MHDEAMQKIIDEARYQIREISIQDAYKQFNNGGRVTFVDMREPEELALGYIKDSVYIRGDELEMQSRHLLPDKGAPIILYCGSGIRSIMMALTLKDLGYENVSTMTGGIEAWKAAGYEVETDGLLSLDQITHYSRQIIVGDIGVEGQKKLLDAKVLLVGAGGLGSSAGLYLAAAGLGTLGIVDFDRVDETNLSRQVLHTYSDIGRPKIESAKDTINRVNPEVNVITYNEKLGPENALDIIKDFDIILDGSDNFPTKFLLNDAAYFAGKPYIYGGAVRFEGQASVFWPEKGGTCLRCMMPKIPEDGMVPT